MEEEDLSAQSGESVPAEQNDCLKKDEIDWYSVLPCVFLCFVYLWMALVVYNSRFMTFSGDPKPSILVGFLGIVARPRVTVGVIGVSR